MASSDRSVILEIATNISGFVHSMQQGQAAATNFQHSVVSGASAVAQGLHRQEAAAKQAAVPLLAIGAAAALGVGYAVKAFADFDERMSSVKSLSHATADEQERLKNAALTAGSAIGYSATQAADAEIELVKAGVQVSDITGGALSGSLKLAAAGQIDVAQATEIAASTLTQFGLKGKDVSHVADLLAAGADKALGGVSDLGEGMKYIGPVANAAGVSLEQTVGTLALLAQNAILGEMGGTSLRGVLLSLTSPSALAAKEMSKYGIEVYNAQGKFVGFNGVAEQLHKKLGNLSQSERDAALGRIFGNAQITAATILMKGGAKEVDKWTKAVDEQGFATEQAVGKMDNLNGDVTKLKASFQTAAIVTGAAADGPLRSMVQVVTDLVNAYNAAPGAVQATVLGLGAITAAVALTTGTMLVGVPKIVAFNTAMVTLATSNIPLVSTAAASGVRTVAAFGAGMRGAAVQTAGLGRATKIAVTAAAGMGKALSAVTSFLLGPWGIALAAAAAVVVGLNVAADSGAASQEELSNAIITSAKAADLLAAAGKRSGVSKFVAGDTAKNLKDIKSVLRDLGDEGFTLGTVLRNAGDSISSTFGSGKQSAGIFQLKEEAKSLKDLGSALANVAAADAPAAARAFSKIRDQQHLSRQETLQFLDTMPEYKAQLVNQASSLGIAANQTNLLRLATGQYQAAAETAKEPTKDNATALEDLQKSGEDAAKAIQDTANALKGLTSPTLDAREAQRQFLASIDAVTQSIKENGTTLDTNSDKGRANESALDGIARAAENAAGALYQQTGSQQQATDALQKGRDELIRALGQYGITGDAALAYADKIIGTPTDWATQFTNNAPQAGGSVDGYASKVKAVPSLVSTLFRVQGDSSAVDQILAKIRQARSEMSDLNGAASGNGRMGTFAVGGAVYGPGSGTSDSIPAWLSNGEHVITAREVAAAGGHAAIYAFRKSLVAGQSPAPKFAAGGEVTVAPKYATAPPTIIIQTGQQGQPQPLIGSVDMRIDSGTPQDAIGQLMFALRTLDNGGRP